MADLEKELLLGKENMFNSYITKNMYMTSKFKNFLKFLVKNYYRTKGHFNIKIFKKIKESENMLSSIYITQAVQSIIQTWRPAMRL